MGATACPGDSFACCYTGTAQASLRRSVPEALRGDLLSSTAQRLPRVHPPPRFLDLHRPLRNELVLGILRAHISQGDASISILTR